MALATQLEAVSGCGKRHVSGVSEEDYEGAITEFEDSALEKEYEYALSLLEEYINDGFSFDQSLTAVMEQENHLDPIVLKEFAVDYGFDKYTEEEEVDTYFEEKGIEINDDDIKYMNEVDDDLEY